MIFNRQLDDRSNKNDRNAYVFVLVTYLVATSFEFVGKPST